MKDLRLVLNFEARGVSGPVFMFETGAGNGPVIREFARAAPRPVANSLMDEVYRRMPNDTDFTVFKQAGLPGLNFAFIGDARHYHAPTDDIAHLSLRSLQHQGAYALSLARHFGNLDLAALHGPDAVYFDLFGRWLVHYPSGWAILLALLAAISFLGVAAVWIRSGKVTAAKLFLACLTWAAIPLVVGTAFGLSYELLNPLWRVAPAWFGKFLAERYWLVAVALTVMIGTTLHATLGRWIAPAELALGSWFWWLIVAVATAIWMPGASYVGLWPLLFGLFGTLVVSGLCKTSWSQFLWLGVSAVPVMVLIMPLVRGFYVALGPRAVLIPMVVLAFALGALSLQIEAISGNRRWLLPATGLLVALVAVIV